MIYPSILERKYQEYKPFVEKVSEKVQETLKNYCEQRTGYAFIYRIKSIESLAEKIETGRFKKWSDLDDLFACTVIIPTLSHEKEVMDFCKNTFNIISTIKRGQNEKPPDAFRFDSTRIYAKLKKPDDTNEDNILSIYKVKFEIQIKTAFEHAWSVSTHDLVYKSSEIDWKKLRLAAQIKATVEQLDTLIMAFQETSGFIEDNDYSEIKRKRQLATEINKLFANKIPDELRPKDMSRFCDNLYRLIVNAGQEKNIKQIMKQIVREVQSTPTNQIPLSLSLFQYFLGILIDKKIIEPPIDNYHCHITDELKTLYPSIETNIDSIFLYSDDS